MDVRKALAEKILLFDGAMGTMLQAAGLPAGGLPEIYNLTHPEIVLGIHKDYVAAGCDVVTSNTFQAGELKLAGSGYTPEEVIAAGVRLAKESGAKYTALDIGPLGQLMKPMGTLSFEDAYAMFRRQIEAGAAAGADLILFETMSDLLEVKAGVLAAKECCDLPVFVTMTYQQDGRTFVGCSPECAALTLSGLGVNALGVNCSLGPEELMPVVETLLEWSRVPVMVQPNAGLPKMKDGKTVYDISTEEFANLTSAFAAKGAAVLGGCCGTTPAFLSALRKKIDGMDRVLPKQKPITAVCSGTRTAVLDGGVSVIGERINPTGKKRLKEKLREQDFDYIAGEAINQKQHGADILDVNCGLPEIDEAAVLCRAVEEVQAVTDLPLQIDSSDPEAIAQAVRRYNGKPIINSVSGKAESLQTILPIAAKYGAMVVGLTLDETGIPETAEKRYEIAQRIVREAEKYGVPRQDILIDCLVLTASAQQELVMETLRAIQLVKAGLGVKTVLGVSNVSFGLPSRPVLNSVFLAAGFGAGLDAAIVNPLSEEIMQTVRAFRVLNAQDKDAAAYIANASVEEKPVVKAETRTLSDSIMEGRAEETAAGTRKLLETTAPMEIIDQWFIPALDKVGEQYEQGQLFLPQLIRAAEAVKSGFEVLRAAMPEGGADKGTIVVATVEGDIHDIGKNIAKMLLQNYGYRVIDLGKDVPVEKVVQAAMESGAPLIGLSALMTTTVTSMRDTITALRKAGCTAKIMAGGAVLNEEYIQYVGADYYARDARIGVQIAAQVFGGQQ